MSDRTITMVHDGNARPTQDLMRHDAKSLALFVAIQKKLANAPDRQDRLQSALDWAVRFAKERTEDAWLAAWMEVLERAMESPEGLEDMYRLMLDTDEYAKQFALRRCIDDQGTHGGFAGFPAGLAAHGGSYDAGKQRCPRHRAVARTSSRPALLVERGGQ